MNAKSAFRFTIPAFFLIIFVWITSGCAPQAPAAIEGENNVTIQITSSAFTEGGSIPRKYSCEGENISPPLSWTGVPGEARGLALITDDPDAPSGVFVHWVIYNIDPSQTGLAEGVPPANTPQALGAQGKNSSGKVGFMGPCPPRGSNHRYFFRLYALDAKLDLGPGASRAQLDQAMKGHVLATGQLMGTFSR